MVKKKVRDLCLKCWSLSIHKEGCKDVTHPRLQLRKFLDKIISGLKQRMSDIQKQENSFSSQIYRLKTLENKTFSYGVLNGKGQDEYAICVEILKILEEEKSGRETVKFLKANAMTMFALANLHDRKGTLGMAKKRIRKEDWLTELKRGLSLNEKILKKPSRDVEVLKKVAAEINLSKNLEVSEEAKIYAEKWIEKCLISCSEDAKSNYLMLNTSKVIGSGSVILFDTTYERAVVLFFSSGPKLNSSSLQVGNKIIFTGGEVKRSQTTKECSYFDFTSKTSEVKEFPPMIIPRIGHLMARAGRTIYCIGGETPELGASNFATCEKCSGDYKKWTLSPQIPHPVHGQSIFVLDERYLYITNLKFLSKLDAMDEEAGWKIIRLSSGVEFGNSHLTSVQSSPTELYLFSPGYDASVYKYKEKGHKIQVETTDGTSTSNTLCSIGIQKGRVIIRSYFTDILVMQYYFCDSRAILEKKIPLMMQCRETN